MRDLTPLPWMADAACAQVVDPNVFFTDPRTMPGRQYAQDAKAICATCPVIEPCLSYALSLGTVEGVWGGTTEPERRQLIARRRTRGTCA